MIASGNPWDKENAKELRKSGAVLFFSTSANMLFALEEGGWIPLGHVIPTDVPRWNRPRDPQVKGNLPVGM